MKWTLEQLFPLFFSKPINDYFHQMSYRKVTFVLKCTLENLSVYGTMSAEIKCESQNIPLTLLKKNAVCWIEIGCVHYS